MILWRRFVNEARTRDWRDLCDVLGLSTQASTPVEYWRLVTDWADEAPVERWARVEILLAQRAAR